MKIGAHWSSRAYPQAVELGFDFCWLNPDTFGDPTHQDDLAAFIASGLEYVLTFSWSEDRLLNRGEAWTIDVRHTYAWLGNRGLLRRCLAVQFDDEFYERVVTSCGNPSVFPPAQWPILSSLPATLGPTLLGTVAHFHGERARELAQIFGDDLPAAGFGCSATGAMELPTFPQQQWWGCNFYLGPGYLPDAASVHRLYAGAARTGLQLMPILGVFADGDREPPSLMALADCYLPIAEQYGAWAVGVFCLHHPSTYDPAHGPGRGILQLPSHYAEGVRWLTAKYGTRDRSLSATR